MQPSVVGRVINSGLIHGSALNIGYNIRHHIDHLMRHVVPTRGGSFQIRQ
jgi:hypothetical protein